MEDIEALSLLRQEIESVTLLSNLPDNYEDETELTDFQDNCESIIHHASDTLRAVTKYAKEIDRQLEQLSVTLNNSTKTVKKRIIETLNTIRNDQSEIRVKSSRSESLRTHSAREKTSVQNEPTKPKESSHLDARKMELTQRLQKIEELKQNLQESIVLTQQIMNDINNHMGATMKDVENLKGSINGWKTAEKKKKENEHSKRDENRRKSAKEGQRRNSQDDRKRRKKEEQEQKEEEERRKREYKELERKEKERRLKEEDERRKREEEERNRKIEEERVQRAAEERMREEEEDRKRKDEEEKRLKEEEEHRQREDEEKRRRKEEEEARKRNEKERQKREEAERLRKLEEERKRMEEENRRRDPANWKLIEYKRSEEQTNAFHGGVCCQIAAMDSILAEEDLECLASDEWREEDKVSVLNVDEKLAGSIIRIDAKSGEKTFPVPMRVYVPHCSISDSSDEIVVKTSIDGGEWTEQRPVSVPPAQISRLGLNYAGIDVSKFTTVKMVTVAKTQSQEFVVDQGGIKQVSTVDKNIKLFVPRDTFSKPCKLKLAVRQMKDHSLAFATQYYEHCHNVLSTSSVMKITSEIATDKCIELDLARNASNYKRSGEKGKYIHVYKCKGDSWKIADSEFKERNMNVSVSLPSRKESYVVMEIEGRPILPNEEFLKAADELYFHSNASIVQVIAKQRADDPHMMMILCVGRERVASRISELELLGYSLGPDTSKEFPLLDGQSITLQCSGNINMATGREVKLTFHSFMETAKQEVRLQVVDEYRQKDMHVYLGNLQFEVMRDTRDGAFYNRHTGSLPLTLPKEKREQKRKTRIEIHFPHYLTALAKFLAIRLTTQPNDDSWLQVIYRLDSFRDMETIRRRAVADNDREMCEFILHDWMKYKQVQDNKIKEIKRVLRNCQMQTLAEECKKFVKFHKEHLSDQRMFDMAKKVEGDWESLALTLGLSKNEIDMCRRGEGDSNEEKALIVLSKWRVSEVAIISGFNVFNDLLGRLENAQSNMGLREHIRQMLI